MPGGSTSRFGLQYQTHDSPPAGHTLGQNLAEEVEARLAYAGAQGGKSIVATAQSPAGSSYDWLGTPDRVQNVVIENDGDLLLVYFSALVKRGGSGAGPAAALFIGANQHKVLVPGTAAPTAQEAATGTNAVYAALYTDPVAGGLTQETNTSGSDHSTVTTGMAVAGAGILTIERLAAGTYDVGIKFKNTLLTAKERRLFVWTKEWPSSGI